MSLVFIHGWGYGPDVFDPLVERLSVVPHTRIDLGFFGPEQLEAEDEVTIVAHSFGLLWWLHERPFTAKRVISLNGFARFSAAEDFADGVHPRILSRMQRRVTTDGIGVLRDFRILCDDPNPDPPAEFNRERLAWGLSALQEWDARETWSALDVPRSTLCGEWDNVVTEQMSAACFDHLETCPGAAHMMPVTHADWCADAIMRIMSK